MEVTVTAMVRDEGTIIVLQGIATDGTDRIVDFACEARPAQDILLVLASGEDVEVEVEDWAIIGITDAPHAG